MGNIPGVIKGDTRSLDCGSYDNSRFFMTGVVVTNIPFEDASSVMKALGLDLGGYEGSSLG